MYMGPGNQFRVMEDAPAAAPFRGNPGSPPWRPDECDTLHPAGEACPGLRLCEHRQGCRSPARLTIRNWRRTCWCKMPRRHALLDFPARSDFRLAKLP